MSGGMFFMSPEDMEAHREAHKAANHAVNSLLHTLSETDLHALGMVMDSIAVSDEPLRIAAYMSGRITAIQEQRFNICAACGENHDAQLAQLTGDDKPQDEVPPWVEARRRDHGVTAPRTEIGSTDSLRFAEVEMMKEYNLDDLRDGDTNALLGFVCMGCDMKYPTIEDRMMQPPGVEGCSGCQQKAKFG